MHARKTLPSVKEMGGQMPKERKYLSHEEFEAFHDADQRPRVWSKQFESLLAAAATAAPPLRPQAPSGWR